MKSWSIPSRRILAARSCEEQIAAVTARRQAIRVEHLIERKPRLTYMLDGGYDRALQARPPEVTPKPYPSDRYRHPYDGSDMDKAAMQTYLDWGYGLVEQLRCGATHGFFVI